MPFSPPDGCAAFHGGARDSLMRAPARRPRTCRTKDQIIVFTLGKSADDRAKFNQFQGTAVSIAKKWKVLPSRIHSVFKSLDSSWSYLDAIMYLANHTPCTLVVGAAGKGDEERRHGRKPEGQLPLGKMAVALMQRTKVPVMVIKPWSSSDGGRFLHEFLAKPSSIAKPPRLGVGGSGYRWLIPIDATATCRMAMDACLTKMQNRPREGDSVYLFRVMSPGDDAWVHALAEEWLEKLEATKQVAHGELALVPKGRTGIKEEILDAADRFKIDFIVMGSNELSTGKQHFLGSVASAVSREAHAHCMVVKNYANAS